MKRTYNDNERWALYEQSSGRCQICGKELWGVFEVDHIRPFSKGGTTTLDNAQVLCVQCNRSKGNMYEEWKPFPITLRGWQVQAHQVWLRSGENVLIVATPGAGKTIFALNIAHEELSTGKAEQLLVVVPSDNLRDQWAIEAASVGINLSKEYDSRFKLADDYHGVVTTYQTIAERTGTAKTFKRYVQDKRTLLIADEVHHVGQGLSWATGFEDACYRCYRRLLITGTPFRSDRNTIPFVRYNLKEDGSWESASDYEYGYGDALRDQVVRELIFQTFDGEASWFEPDGELVNAKFEDELPSREEAIRLRHALDHRGEWLEKVIRDADEMLDSMREVDPRAAGLVVTKDVKHAIEVAGLIERITGKQPTLVTSHAEYNYPANDSPSDIIDEFRYNKERWIVAVKMVSEGVDIKRLRVGVWATNITTELFFRQVIGRIVRIDSDGAEHQWACQFIPRLSPLTDYAETIKQERKHAVDDLPNHLDDEEIEKIRDEMGNGSGLFQTVFNESNGYKSTVIADSGKVEQEDLAEVFELAAKASIELSNYDAVRFAALLRAKAAIMPQVEVKAKTNGQAANGRAKTLQEEKKEERDRAARLLAMLIRKSNDRLQYSETNRLLNQAHGVRTISECTLEQLRQRVAILRAWMEAYENGTGQSFTPKRYLREQSSAGVS